MTLVDFLLARATEDEQWANRMPSRARTWAELRRGHWSREQVLTHCEAIWLVVREYQAHRTRKPDRLDEDSQKRHRGIVDALETSMRGLALPYADDADFRQEWLP